MQVWQVLKVSTQAHQKITLGCLPATTALTGKVVRFLPLSASLNHLICSPLVAIDFQVTDPLPDVSFPLERSFAGSISVDRDGHPNNSLFFWGFEKENGSLTAAAGENSDQPWGIWLNGGCVTLIFYQRTQS